MKKLLIVFAVVLFTAGFANKVLGQAAVLVTASNSAGGEIMAPLTLTADVALEFGKLAVSASTGGTVVLTPAAVTTVSSTGGVSLMSGTTRTSGKYTVGGTASYVYTITVPANGTVTISDGASHSMAVSNFQFTSIASPTGTGGTLTAGGTDNFYVGATLTVGAAQAVGKYTGSFNVSVNYN